MSDDPRLQIETKAEYRNYLIDLLETAQEEKSEGQPMTEAIYDVAVESIPARFSRYALIPLWFSENEPEASWFRAAMRDRPHVRPGYALGRMAESVLILDMHEMMEEQDPTPNPETPFQREGAPVPA